MKESLSIYQEGYSSLELDAGFFRPDSIVARDFSVLTAAHQYQKFKGGLSCRWLDLMCGCGIRSLRWGLEAIGANPKDEMRENGFEIWVNDADIDRAITIKSNLKPLLAKGIPVFYKNDLAEVLLAKAYLEKTFFNLIDLDCFGCPNSLLQPVLKVMSFNGVLILSSTDGRSTTGHDRTGAIRTLAASVRTHPASWEIALRLQLAAIARQSWLLGRGIEPLACFSDGRTFRIFVQINRKLLTAEEHKIGFLARCNSCGEQLSQTLINLREWKECCCGIKDRHLIISGPLWLGPLQSSNFLTEIKEISHQLLVPIADLTKNLIDRLQADLGATPFSWSSNDLARRVPLKSPPSLDSLINLLRTKGFEASRSGVVPGHFRTNASMRELLQICENVFLKGVN